MNFFNSSYPVHSMPSLLRETALELHRNLNVPLELTAPLVLAVASLACQDAVDVARPNCDPSPCLIYLIVVAGSGERKTTVIRKLISAIMELEDELAGKAESQMAGHEAENLAWEIVKKTLLNQIESNAKKDKPLNELQERLTRHVMARPSAPIIPKFAYEDPTPEAIVNGLSRVWPSAAMISSEGSGFFHGRASHDLPMWNKLWDGAGVGQERVGRGNVTNREARCGLILAVQQGPFEAFCESRGAEAMDIGFLPRFLVSRVPPRAGLRQINPDAEAVNWKFLPQFQLRLKELLRSQVENRRDGKHQRAVLHFSPNAEQRWIEEFNKCESMTGMGGYLSKIPGFASKVGENAARIAAVFNFFEGRDADIDQNEIDGAYKICGWHAEEFLTCFAHASNISKEQRDAKSLERWLFSTIWANGRGEVKKNDVRQNGPNALRNKVYLTAAVNALISQNKVRIVTDSTKTRYIQLNPEFFNNFISA